MKKVFFSLLMFLLASSVCFSQLTGTKTIPGDYATLKDAVDALNAVGVGAGGVTFQVGANQSLNASMQIGSSALSTGVTAASSANPVIIDGGNFAIDAAFAGTRTGGLTATVANDAAIVINGTDYVTIKNFVFTQQASNTTTATSIENAIAMHNRNATTPFDGCQNITVQGCNFSLGEVSTGGAVIHVASNIFGGTSSLAWAGYGTTPGDMHREITITNNTFSGYTFINYNGATTANGRKLFVNNNTLNQVGGAAVTAYGLFGKYLDSCTFNDNIVTMAPTHSTTGYLAFLSTNAGAYQEATGNTITLQAATTTSTVYGIYFTSIGANKKMNNNTVQFGPFTALTTGSVYGLYATYSGGNNNFTQEMNGNTCRDQVLPGSSGTTSSSVYLFYNSASVGINRQVQLKNNTITNNTKANGGTVYALYAGTCDTAVISGNLINGFNWTNNATSSAATFYGIYGTNSAEGQFIYDNNVGNVSIAGTSTSTAGSIQGIRSTLATAFTGEVYNNTVSGLSFGAGVHTGNVTGIYVGASTNNVYNNKVYDLSSEQAAGTVYGTSIVSGNVNMYNNLIGDLKAPSASSATADAIRGISITGATATSAINVSFNSVNLNATSSGADFSTSCLFHTTSATATTATLNLRNNIFVNNSTANGAGFAIAFRRSTTALNNYGLISNNNLFYAGTPSPKNLIFYDGTNADQPIAAYKTRVSPIDNASVSEAPNFLSTTGSDANFLHINTTLATQIESGGITVAGITSDYDGNTRNVTTPDIGADEFAGISADLTPPTISFTPLVSFCGTGVRTITATITDASGVPTAGAGLPVLYWKIGAGSYSAAVATSLGSNQYQFSLGSGTVTGDVISYYIVAQDGAAIPNVGASPATGAGGFSANPPAASTPPSTPNSYTNQFTMTGTYTVGASGSYPTLTAAVADYNSRCLSGAVIFELTDATYGGSETFPISINANVSSSSVNTLTIQPKAGTAVTISGTSGAAVGSLIRLNGAKYVTIDGLNTGGSSLTIENTSATTGTAVIWISSNGVGAGANNNAVKNCSIKGGIAQNTSALVTYGVVVAGSTISATATSITAGDDNDNTIITGNTFTKLRYAIFTRGGGAANPNTGTVISNNIIGASSFGADQIGKGGIVSREEDGIVITGNEIMFVGGDFANTTAGTDRVGICFSTDALWAPTAVMVKNALVTKNKIHDIVEERSFSAVGISVGAADGTNATNNLIANNMISNIKANGTSSDQTIGIGISAGNGDKIVFNSINLTGDIDPTSGSVTPTQSAYGLRITSAAAVTNLSVRNNIIVNDLTSSSASALKFACIDLPASFVWGTGGLNYNDLYVNTSNPQSYTGSVGNTAGTFHTALTDWQTATSQEANSINVAPVFIATTDLHLVPANNIAINALGTPVAGITTDFDNDTRNATNPDIGADEFDLPAGIDMKAVSLVLPANTSCLGSAETVTIRVQNVAGSTIDFTVNPLTVNTTVTGVVTVNMTATVNTGTLASGATLDVPMTGTLNMSTLGVYTLDATTVMAADVNTANNAMPTVNRTTTALTAGTVSSSASSFCAVGTPVLTIAGNAGVGTVQWLESTTSATGPWTTVGPNSTTYTPASSIAATTWYRAALSCYSAKDSSNIVMVELNNPQALTTTPGLRCGPGPVTLSATLAPGNTINWYAASTGGSSLGTGTSFTTPSINSTTNYYVGVGSGFTSATVGPVNPSALGTISSSNIAIGTQAMYFDVLGASATISTVDIYPTAAIGSNFSIVIRNSAGTDIYTSPTYTTTVTGGATPQTVTLNATVPTGTAYKFGMGINPGLQRNTTGASYPYALPGVISFTGNTFDPVYWYWFYNINIQSGCEGVRTLVPATVTPASGSLAGTTGGAQVCQSAIVATGNTYYDNSCNLIASVTPFGLSPVSGSVQSCVKIDATVPTFGGQPYVQRHYDIEPATNAATATGAITMYFLQSEFDAYNAVRGIHPPLPTGPADAAGISNVRITQFHGTGTAPGNYTGTATYIDSTAGNIVWDATNNRWAISISVNGFSGFYLHTGSGALPVTFADLKGIRNGSVNQLSWKTFTEINNQGFYIERSADGRNFNSLGFVASKAVFYGNSTATIEYSFNDAKVLSGGNYYRLKQVDKDGKISYSNVVLIKGIKPLLLTVSNLYPNPARDVVKVSIESPVANNITVVITDITGKVLSQKAATVAVGDNTINMDISVLPSGSYMLKIVCADACETASRKFNKLK